MGSSRLLTPSADVQIIAERRSVATSSGRARLELVATDRRSAIIWTSALGVNRREEPMRFWLPALVAIAVLPVSAHHPFTPYYDASKPGSVTGVVAEIRVINPHV